MGYRVIFNSPFYQTWEEFETWEASQEYIEKVKEEIGEFELYHREKI